MYAVPGARQGSPAWRRRLRGLAGVAAVGGAVLLGAASPASAAGSDDAPVVVINQQINNIVVEDARGAEMMFELKPVYITHISTNNTSGDNSPVDVPSFSWGSVSQGTF